MLSSPSPTGWEVEAAEEGLLDPGMEDLSGVPREEGAAGATGSDRDTEVNSILLII